MSGAKFMVDGPIKQEFKRKIREEPLSNVSHMGYIPPHRLKTDIQESMFVVLPSECYENNPLSVLEAFALGKPVIGSRIGGIPELIKDGKTGLTFETGNPDDLRKKISYLLNNTHRIVVMGKNARRLAEREFGSEKYYRGLINIYKMVTKKH